MTTDSKIPTREAAAHVLRACAVIIKQYREYSEAMREHGRGFDPTDQIGAHAEDVEYCARDLALRLFNH